jgi:hypothetical protein
MTGSWSSGDQIAARVKACKGELRPKTYTVRVDDTDAQWRYQIAAEALGMRKIPGFFVWCAEYVILNSRHLKKVRASIREARKARKAHRRAERRRKP